MKPPQRHMASPLGASTPLAAAPGPPRHSTASMLFATNNTGTVFVVSMFVVFTSI